MLLQLKLSTKNNIIFKNKKKRVNLKDPLVLPTKDRVYHTAVCTAFIPFQYNVSHGLGYPKCKSSLR